MQIVIHAGAHFTDEESLLRALLKNRPLLEKHAVAVPGPRFYRLLLKQILNNMIDNPPMPGAREVFLDNLVDEAKTKRLVLSNPNFFCAPRAALRSGILYPNAPERLRLLRKLFPQDEIELFIGMCDLGTYLPKAFAESPKPDMESYIGHVDPRDLRWSQSLQRIRAALPDIPITVWCNEDTPVIWGKLMHVMAGVEPDVEMAGSFDLLKSIMSEEGTKRFFAFLESHPGMSEMQLRRVIAAFLEKFALEEKIEEEIDQPGWTEDLMDDLTEAYEADIDVIKQMPGVRFIS